MSRCGRPVRRAARGFSLIEVIVALVVISGFGAALFVWAGQTQQSAARAVQAPQRVELEHNVTELAAGINPGTHPSGEWRSATHLYRWTSEPLRGPLDQVRTFAGVGPYQVALYRLRFAVTAADDPTAVLHLEREVAGYRQVRPRSNAPPGLGVPEGSP